MSYSVDLGSESEQWFPAMNPEDFNKPEEPVEEEQWSEMYGEQDDELDELFNLSEREDEQQEDGDVVEHVEIVEHVEPQESNFVEQQVAQIVEDNFEQVPIDFVAHGAHGAHQAHILIPNGQFSDLEHYQYPVVYQEQIEPHHYIEPHQQNHPESQIVSQEQNVVIEHYVVDTGAQVMAPIQQNVIYLEGPAPQYQQKSELRMLLEQPVQPIQPMRHGTKRSLPPPTIPWKRLCLHKWPKVHNPKGASQDRPTITYATLATLALLNSPNLTASFYNVYTFILHHFPFFRFSANWEASVRRAMAGTPSKPSEMFQCVQQSKVGALYTLKNVALAREMARCEVKRSSRDYSRMLNGELGLPRPLFYQIVGYQQQRFAGPENSAMFYHQLQMKCLPAPAHFKEYTEHVERYEPRCEEQERDYGFEFREEGMEQQEVEMFHHNIDEHFRMQYEMMMAGAAHGAPENQENQENYEFYQY